VALETGNASGHTEKVKRVVSLPDDVFEAAEELAREMGVSRSRLYSIAIEEFVAQCRQGDVRHRLDRIYAQSHASVDPSLAELQSLTVSGNDW